MMKYKKEKPINKSQNAEAAAANNSLNTETFPIGENLRAKTLAESN